MKKIAFLVYDYEFRHRKSVIKLRRYLESVAVTVRVNRVSETTITELQKFLEECSCDVLFLAYIGHGGPKGWSGYLNKPLVSYADLIPVLQPVSTLVVVNDTCHALRMLKPLKRARVPERTMFLSPYGSRSETFAAVVNSILRAWPCGQTHESHVSSIIVLRGSGRSFKYASQVRWGSSLDRLFYGTQPASSWVKGDSYVNVTPESPRVISVEIVSE